MFNNGYQWRTRAWLTWNISPRQRCYYECTACDGRILKTRPGTRCDLILDDNFAGPLFCECRYVYFVINRWHLNVSCATRFNMNTALINLGIVPLNLDACQTIVVLLECSRMKNHVPNTTAICFDETSIIFPELIIRDSNCANSDVLSSFPWT